jgi:hypothetical protein
MLFQASYGFKHLDTTVNNAVVVKDLMYAFGVLSGILGAAFG